VPIFKKFPPHKSIRIRTTRRESATIGTARNGSVRVRSMGWSQFSYFRFNSRGDVLAVEGNCPGGICPRGMCRGKCPAIGLGECCVKRRPVPSLGSRRGFLLLSFLSLLCYDCGEVTQSCGLPVGCQRLPWFRRRWMRVAVACRRPSGGSGLDGVGEGRYSCGWRWCSRAGR